MPDIYDDPDLRDDDDYPDQVRFSQVGDSVRGHITRIEKINTRYGPTLKYWINTGQREMTMLAGSKNLKGQLISLRPRPGDMIDIRLVELRSGSNGTLKVFDIETYESGSGGAAASTPAPSTPPREPDEDDIYAT
jgi:hypothetical protein